MESVQPAPQPAHPLSEGQDASSGNGVPTNSSSTSSQKTASSSSTVEALKQEVRRLQAQVKLINERKKKAAELRRQQQRRKEQEQRDQLEQQAEDQLEAPVVATQHGEASAAVPAAVNQLPAVASTDDGGNAEEGVVDVPASTVDQEVTRPITAAPLAAQTEAMAASGTVAHEEVNPSRETQDVQQTTDLGGSGVVADPRAAVAERSSSTMSPSAIPMVQPTDLQFSPTSPVRPDLQPTGYGLPAASSVLDPALVSSVDANVEARASPISTLSKAPVLVQGSRAANKASASLSTTTGKRKRSRSPSGRNDETQSPAIDERPALSRMKSGQEAPTSSPGDVHGLASAAANDSASSPSSLPHGHAATPPPPPIISEETGKRVSQAARTDELSRVVRAHMRQTLGVGEEDPLPGPDAGGPDWMKGPKNPANVEWHERMASETLKKVLNDEGHWGVPEGQRDLETAKTCARTAFLNFHKRYSSQVSEAGKQKNLKDTKRGRRWARKDLKMKKRAKAAARMDEEIPQKILRMDYQSSENSSEGEDSGLAPGEWDRAANMTGRADENEKVLEIRTPRWRSDELNEMYDRIDAMSAVLVAEVKGKGHIQVPLRRFKLNPLREKLPPKDANEPWMFVDGVVVERKVPPKRKKAKKPKTAKTASEPASEAEQVDTGFETAVATATETEPLPDDDNAAYSYDAYPSSQADDGMAALGLDPELLQQQLETMGYDASGQHYLDVPSLNDQFLTF